MYFISLDSLLDGVKTLAVVCCQFGDTGKGKFSDYFASRWADVTARGTGGANAGHTVVVGGKKRIFHLLPVGILQDREGKITILGNGMVIDLKNLCHELDTLDEEELSYEHLMISKDAHVVMPYHVGYDQRTNVSQKDGGLGTTGRGIGPCYTDKTARHGIRMSDLFSRDTLVQKLKKINEHYSLHLAVDEVLADFDTYKKRISPFIRDTAVEMHHLMKQGKRILLEGAQGLLLSVEHGTYPYVTSSDPSVNGTASGVGISARAIDLTLGIVKFPFMTRVGGGPFPTELGGMDSELYCGEYDGNKHTKLYELQKYAVPHEVCDSVVNYNSHDPLILDIMNSADSFRKGIGIRLVAGEYGATTGRPRRIGWTDAVAVKYAVGVNGPLKFVLTKVDSLAGIDSFNICYGYRQKEKLFTDFNRDIDFLRNVDPVYTSYEGYDSFDEKTFQKLPLGLHRAITDFEQFTDAEVAVISVGPERNQTIVK